MRRFFLDTGFLIALESSDDQHHKAAQGFWYPFLETGPMLVTTSYVFDEVTTYFNSRAHHSKAVEVGQNLLESQSIECIHISQDLFESGWEILKNHNDKRYSLTDCISFAVMKKEGLQNALSFDRHFEQAGFHLLP
jgi:uncharacterized protein